MKRTHIVCLFLFLWLMGASPALARADTSQDPNRETLKSLLDELQHSIHDADKRMVAHPRFIKELQVLVDRYKARLREIFLDEDFADGDYTKNPEWIIEAGHFRVTPRRTLWCRVRAERPSQAASSREDEEPLSIILREIARSRDKNRRNKRTASVEKEASIRTLARIGTAFEVDLSFVSESDWGSMEVVLLGGKPVVPRYRLVYQAAPSRNRPIEIVRERDSRRYTIESATQYPVLDDGTSHRIQWIRDTEGHMRVTVDGVEVLSTVELYYRSDFVGLKLINRGGTYEWESVRVLQAPAAIK
ncbi:MAG: hypothetical protein SV375_00440 [Thermodesulfobacteriota bacterium]|nr:hypothetical protein [Thermodesulfobacteriota bacterium]